MGKPIIPTFRFEKYTEVTPEFLAQNGIKGILTDLDSTLTEHDFPEPDDELLRWVGDMKSAGIPICIVSNNKIRRTAPFARKIGVGYLCNSWKPHRPALRIALGVIGCHKDNAVFIGDQLYTDIKGAVKMGMKSVLVKPIGTKTTPYIRFKRMLERKQGIGNE